MQWVHHFVSSLEEAGARRIVGGGGGLPLAGPGVTHGAVAITACVMQNNKNTFSVRRARVHSAMSKQSVPTREP